MDGDPTAATRTDAFRRPLSRVLVDLLGAPVGAVLFLGFSLALLTGLVPLGPMDLPWRVIGLLVFGFFGILMAAGVPSSLRRGMRRTALEVGPAAMWTPEMGRLAWNEIAEVRLEAARGFAGGDHGESGSTLSIGSVTISDRGRQAEQIPMTTYQRLGIVPSDPARGDKVRRAPAMRMVGAYLDFLRRMRPSASLPDPSALAPFGVYDFDIGGRMYAAVESVQRFRPVTGAFVDHEGAEA